MILDLSICKSFMLRLYLIQLFHHSYNNLTDYLLSATDSFLIRFCSRKTYSTKDANETCENVLS